MNITEKVQKHLLELADSSYRDFNASLMPGINNMLGVRLPQLRKLAKEIIRTENWQTFVKATDTRYFEETMLQAMIIGVARMELEKRLEHIRMFVPRIDSWGVCDTFCSELKTAVKQGKERMWDFIQPYLKSSEEFELRFGIVMLFHYINEEHIDNLLSYADTFRHEAYYARMGMAWLLSICFVKFPEKTLNYLKQSKLDNWTYNKAIQKSIESLRVDKPTKDLLREMKRR